MCQRVVVGGGERKGTWNACYFRGSFWGVDQGTAHLMVGSPAGVKVVVEKVHRKKKIGNDKVF